MTDETIVTPGAELALNEHPELMAHLQNRLGSLVGRSSGYIESLPGEVHRRIDALKNLQDSSNKLAIQFRKEVAELEKKYLGLAQPNYQKRTEIISGQIEPTDEESKREPDEDEEPFTRPPVSEKDPVKGIPEFWLTALKTMPIVSDMITEEDEEALKSLTDIKLEYLNDNPGFKLTFEFDSNEYFSNAALTKTYYLQESDDPRFGDALYDHAEGTTIEWKEGKDLSVTVEIKKQRHKATNKTRTVKKTVPKDTFFNFFKPPVLPAEEEEDIDEEVIDDLNERVQFDYEVGEAIKDRLIPHAIDWFTGKALEYEDEDYDDEFDEEDEFGDEDDDEDDDEDEDDEKAAQKGTQKKGAKAGDQPPDCKQQ